MTDRTHSPQDRLPADLAEIDAELRSIRYEERPSFGPELEAELARAWTDVRHERIRRASRVRQLAAAGLGGVLAVTLGVPSARAAIVRFVGAAIQVAAEPAAPPAPTAVQVPLPPTGDADVLSEPERLTDLAAVVDPLPTPIHEDILSLSASTAAELVDRHLTQELIRSRYPVDLQEARVGGTVRLRLWVKPTGGVDFPSIARGSGVDRLDRAVLAAAPSLRFIPATRRNEAVGTWVEFDVHFEPEAGDGRAQPMPPELLRSGREPRPGPVAPVEATSDPLMLEVGPYEAEDLLREALADPELVDRLGPIDAILTGDPPRGVGPTQWRVDVTAALADAVTRAPDNPAPLLALARIRRKQGLRTDARLLFERGLGLAMRDGGKANPKLLAELHYERGTLLEESWLASRRLGRVRAEALPASSCPQARSSGGAASGFASVDRLIAWNYLCPAQLDRVLATSFEPSTDGRADRAMMTASFEKAVEAYPGHVGANVELLLALADEARWDEMLQASRAFQSVSDDHPVARLMAGLALQRLGRSEEAEEEMSRALAKLPPQEVDRLRDVLPLLDSDQAEEYRVRSGPERRTWEGHFWAALDPIASTRVNEREVEHLARTAYAELALGGVDTDAGRVWVRYGRPDNVRVFGDGPEVRTEFWDYGSGGPDITFRRLATGTALDLTPEGRTYVDELRDVYPHRYGPYARTVSPLVGQVSRFRGRDPGTIEIRVRSRVPQALATGGADLLDIGVFVVDHEGGVEEQSRTTIPARPSPIALQTVAPADARSVIVEVYHRTTGSTAALLEGVRPATAERGGMALSDLMLVRATEPPLGALDAHGGWVIPLSLTEPVADDVVGALFELYDVPASVISYRLSGELLGLDGAPTLDVPIRAAGDRVFASSSRVSARPAARLAEYASVDIRDAPAGRYALRIAVDVPGAPSPVFTERELEIR